MPRFSMLEVSLKSEPLLHNCQIAWLLRRQEKEEILGKKGILKLTDKEKISDFPALNF